MLIDAFRPIVREGGQEAEVCLRLSSTFRVIAAALPYTATTIDRMADHLLDRARAGMDDPTGLAAIEAAYYAR